ncbi:MAG: arylamine N-acetyltransferase, partial [Henriciella sp.]|nr:arylamine N-acetyltransferase [Henriciella sp.]
MQLGHVCSIPFENLDVLLGRPIKLDLASIQRKLIDSNRGGYCFEQNGLMLAALTAMDFDAIGLSARVRVSSARDTIPPRTHLFCKVMLDGVPWLVDVGVGGQSATGPIRMDTHEPQETPHDTRRLSADDDPTGGSGMARTFHQVLHDGTWLDVCDYTGETMPTIDRLLANWWTSTNPESKFRQNLMVALASKDGTRRSLTSHDYTHRRGGTILQREQIKTNKQLLTILAGEFG